MWDILRVPSEERDALVMRLLKEGNWEKVQKDPRMNREAMRIADSAANEACKVSAPLEVLLTWTLNYLMASESFGVKRSGGILDAVVLECCSN